MQRCTHVKVEVVEFSSVWVLPCDIYGDVDHHLGIFIGRNLDRVFLLHTLNNLGILSEGNEEGSKASQSREGELTLQKEEVKGENAL